jgi:hypothetical protein
MKIKPLAVAAAIALVGFSASALADDAAEVAAAAFTVEMPIAALMADDRAKAVVLGNLPGIDQHPAFPQIQGMSLKAIQPFSQGMITDEALAKIAAELAAIK